MPRHDPAKTPPYPWEDDVRAFIAKLRAERAAKEAEAARQAEAAKATETPKRKARKPKDREPGARDGGETGDA